MSDVNLDDLIKKDKEQKKTQKKNVAKKGVKATGSRKRVNKPEGKKSIKNRDNTRFERDSSPVQQRPKDDGRRLRIIGLHPDIKSSDLFELFNKQGALELCKVDEDNFGRSLTTATVVYHNAQHAQTAKRQLDSHKILNSTISVEFAKSKFVPRGKKIFKRNTDNNNFRNNNNRNSGKQFKGKRFRGGRN